MNPTLLNTSDVPSYLSHLVLLGMLICTLLLIGIYFKLFRKVPTVEPSSGPEVSIGQGQPKIDYLLKLFNELIGLPVALLIYLVTPSLLRLIDPASGQFDTGQLAILSFGIIKLIMASLVAWVGYRLNLPIMYRYFIGPLENDLNTGNQVAMLHLVKASIHLLVYFLYMFLAMWSFQTV